MRDIDDDDDDDDDDDNDSHVSVITNLFFRVIPRGNQTEPSCVIMVTLARHSHLLSL